MTDGEPDHTSAASLTDELTAARPAGDRAALDHARARAEQALFGVTSSARLGRFVLLGPIARGGMGVVHGAYDPELDRRVALKLLHPRRIDDPRAHERLLAEARALARLDHPNVVPVHDVLAIDDQIVIVMELLAGDTLATWELARPRSWREVLAVYLQAGRGLAASHALGIVHGDFKPTNAVVGADGRVRVLDFGLARTAAAPPALPSAPPAAAGTGERLGTVAYMAPEQLASGAATAASDQFSFCVALYRALYGVAPFAGDDAVSLMATMRAGNLARPAGRVRVPAWLRALVVRGLAAEPAARHPSMTALLDGIAHAQRSRRRRRVAALTAGAVLGAVALGMSLASPTARPSCTLGVQEVARTWNPARRQGIERALGAIDSPYARVAGPQLLRNLDQHAAAWAAEHRAACEAHRDGSQSAHVFDLRTACLARRRADLGHAVDVLGQLDRASVTHAAEVVARLTPPSSCGEVEALLAGAPPPETIAARVQVAAVRARLGEATALDRAGRSREALDITRAAHRDALAIGHAPAIVEAALLEGRILLGRDELEAAIAPLRSAEQHALATRQLPAAIEAAARRLHVEARAGHPLPGLADRIAILEPLSIGLPGDHFARPLLLNNLGTVYMARADRPAARAMFEAARRELAAATTIDLELTSVDLNLAMVTPAADEREALAAAAWQRWHDEVGPQHLTTLGTLFAYGRYTLDPARAQTRVGEACALVARFHPEQLLLRGDCGTYHAFLTADLGDPAGAAALYDEVEAATAASTDPEVRYWGRLARGYAALARDDHAGALAAFEEQLGDLARDAPPPPAPWWLRQRTAHAHLGAGLAAHGLGRHRRAIGELDRALTTYDELIALNEDVELARRQALARATLAAALRASGDGGPRPAELAAAADAFYRQAGLASAGRLAPR